MPHRLKELSDEIIRIAVKDPLVTYVVHSHQPLFHLLERAFPEATREGRIVAKAKPMGLIVFGHEGQKPITPLTELLDKIPNFEYAKVELPEGKHVGFIAHVDAVRLLPPPESGRMEKRKNGAFDKGLAVSLRDMIDQRLNQAGMPNENGWRSRQSNKNAEWSFKR